MSHFGDFMEGVTVKISEKYKRPPRIDLPYSIAECAARAQQTVDNSSQSLTFEENVLTKIRELRNAKETKKNERRHRLQLLEEAKQKKLDAIAAAEAVEKLKQLSVSDVSYPSTEEISEISPDKNEEICDSTPTGNENNEALETETNNVYASSSKPESNILQPIPVQSNFQAGSLLDDPDPLQKYKMPTQVAKKPQNNISYSKHNIDTMTYKDFENDTSSPFDNVELKTLNDMEQLAQVLQSQRDSNVSCQQYVPEQNYTAVANCASQAQLEGTPYLTNTYMEQPIQGHGIIYSQQPYINNGYYVPPDTCETIPVDNMYMPNYQYYVPTNPYPVEPMYYPQADPGPQMPTNSTFIPQPYYYNNYPYQYQQPNYYNVLPNQDMASVAAKPPDHSIVNTSVKSRSRSVPDIVRELNIEIDLARQRATERSYNPSPAPKEMPSSSRETKEKRKSRRKSEQLPNPFEKLSVELQDMCKKIHGMGFPLDRVARVCTLIGENDKKVRVTRTYIFHLIKE